MLLNFLAYFKFMQTTPPASEVPRLLEKPADRSTTPFNGLDLSAKLAYLNEQQVSQEEDTIVQEKIIEAAEIRIHEIKNHIKRPTLSTEMSAKKTHTRMLVRGYSTNCYIAEVDTPEKFLEFLMLLEQFSSLYPPYHPQESDDVCLYVFDIPLAYHAFSDQVDVATLNAEGLSHQICCEEFFIHTTQNSKPQPIPILHTHGVLRKTTIASFMYSNRRGLLMWKPGLFVHTLPPEQQMNWVQIRSPIKLITS